MKTQNKTLAALSFSLLSGLFVGPAATGCLGGGEDVCASQICEVGGKPYREYLCYCNGNLLEANPANDWPGHLCDVQEEGGEAMRAACETQCDKVYSNSQVMAAPPPCEEQNSATSGVTEATSGATEETPTGGNDLCDNWSPASDVVLFQGIYYVDGGWLSGIVNEPSVLLVCDDARLSLLPGGGFEVGDADAGELLYELGLRNGDKLLELNSLDLDTFEDAAAAFGALYGSSEFDLYLLRGTTYVTLEYSVSYSSP